MALRRSGWPDAAHVARQRWLAGAEPYLKPPRGGLLLVLLPNVPLSDGSEAIIDPTDVPATSVVFGPPRQDPSAGGPHEWYVQPLNPVSFAIGGNPDVEGFFDY